jgi:hypothetical protein
MSRDELLARIDSQARSYDRAGAIEEWAYWISSSIAAICSAIAGLSIVADASAWNAPYGRWITGALAIVPAVWAALDRAIGLRQLSIFNYGVSQKLRALHDAAHGQLLDDPTKETIREYNSIMAGEHEAFKILLTGGQDVSSENKGKEAAMAAELAKKSV